MIFSNPWQSTSAVRSKQRRPTTSGFAGMGYSSSSPVIEEDKLVQACSAGPPMSPTQGAAVYLSNYCMPVFEVASRQHLRSATRHQLLLIPRYRLSTFGRRAFGVAGPTFWNSLADELRTYSILIGLNQF